MPVTSATFRVTFFRTFEEFSVFFVTLIIKIKPSLFPYFNGKLRILLGAPEGTRTPDLLIRSQALYPAELLAHYLSLIIIALIHNYVNTFLDVIG